MSKRRNWAEVREVIEKIRELGLSYKEGARQFGISNSRKRLVEDEGFWEFRVRCCPGGSLRVKIPVVLHSNAFDST